MVSVPGEEAYDIIYRATADFADFFTKVDQANAKLKELKKNAEAASTDSKITVTADTTDASAKIADVKAKAASVGRTKASVKLEADTAAAQAQIDRFKKSIEDISGKKATTLTVDDFLAEAKIDEFKAKLDEIKRTTYKADVEIDLAQLTAQAAAARAILDDLSKNTSPGVAKWSDIQKNNLQALVAEAYVLDRQMQEGKSKVTSFFEGFDTGAAKAKDAMAATDSAVNKLWISIKNLISSQKELFSSLGDSDKSTPGAAGNTLAALGAAGNGLIAVFTAMGKAVIGPIGAIGSLLPLLPMLASGLLALTAPVVGVTSGLGSLVGVLGIMPSVMTAMMSSMAVLKLAITPVTTAITALGQATTAAQITTALKGLSPAAAKAAIDLNNFKKAITNSNNGGVQQSFWGALAPALSQLPNLIKPINALLGGTATALGQVLNTTVLWFESFSKTSAFKDLVQENTYLIQDLGRAFNDILKIITNIAVAAQPLTNMIGNQLANGLDKLASLVDRSSIGTTVQTNPGNPFIKGGGQVLGVSPANNTFQNNSPLRQAFVNIIPTLKTVEDIVKNIFLTVVDLGRAALPFGDNLLTSIDKIVNKWHEWAQAQDKPQSSFRKWLDEVKPILKDVATFMSGIVKGFVTIASNPTNISDLGKTLSALGPAIGSLLSGIMQIATSLGPGTVTVIQDLAKVLNLVGDALQWIGKNKVGSQVLGVVFKILAGFGAAAVILKVVEGVTNMFKTATDVSSKAVDFIKNLRDVANSDASIWEKIKAIFSGGGSGTPTPLQAAADTMVEAAKMMQDAANTMIKAGTGTGVTAAEEGGAAGAATTTDAEAAAGAGLVSKLLLSAVVIAAIAAIVYQFLPKSVQNDLKSIVTSPTNNPAQNKIDTAFGGIPGSPWTPPTLGTANNPFILRGGGQTPGVTTAQRTAPRSMLQTLFGSNIPGEFAFQDVWKGFQRDVVDPIGHWASKDLPGYFTKTIPHWWQDVRSWWDRDVGHYISDFVTNAIPNFFTKTIPHWFSPVRSWWDRDVSTPVSDFVTKAVPTFFTKTIPQWFAPVRGWWDRDVGNYVSAFVTKTIPDFFTKTIPQWFQSVRSWWDRDVGSYVSTFVTKTIPNFFTRTIPQWFQSVRSWWDRDVGNYVSDFVTKTIPNFFTRSIPSWFSPVASWFEKDVINPITNFFTQTLPNSVSNGFKAGINWTINNVINRAIGFINDIIGIIPGIPKLGTVRTLATGGHVPGSGNADTVPALLMPGEYVIRKAAAERIGVNRLNQLNQADRTTQRFADGGPVGTARNGPGGYAPSDRGSGGNPFSSAWHDVTNAISGAASGAFNALGETYHWVRGELASTLNAGWDSIIQPIVNQIASSMGWAGKIGAAGADDMEKGIAALIAGNDSMYNQATANLGGSIPAGQHLQIIIDALKAAGVAQSSWPKWEAGLNTLITRESDWDQWAINLSDINAKAGDPSRGLAQVIGSTFAQYHAPGTSSSIYDPIANVAAAIRYILAVYGDITKVQQANANMAPKGYAAGGLVLGTGLATGGFVPKLAGPSYSAMASAASGATYNHGGTTVNIGTISNPRPEPASMSIQRQLDTKRTFAGRY